MKLNRREALDAIEFLQNQLSDLHDVGVLDNLKGGESLTEINDAFRLGEAIVAGWRGQLIALRAIAYASSKDTVEFTEVDNES